MLSPIRAFLIGVVLLSTLLSCEDHRLTIAGKRYRLKEYISAVGRSLVTNRLSYNDNNQISTKLTYFSTPSPTAPQVTTAYEYNTAGKLVVAQDQLAINYAGDRIRTEYSYDQVGNLIQVKLLRAPANTTAFVPFSTLTYAYANSVLPVRSILQAGGEFDGITEYTYLNGNVSKTVFTPANAGQTSTALFSSYDDKPNPFYGNPVFGVGERLLSKNNFIGAQRTLSYDSNGLLILDNTSVGGPANRTAYQYDSY